MWQLLNAEGPDCHIVIPAFTWLHPDGNLNTMCFLTTQFVGCILVVLFIVIAFIIDHPEAISSALLFLKTES